MYATDDAEYLFRSFGNNPGRDEVIHAKGVDITQVDGGECFGCLITMAIGQIAVHRDRHEAHTEVLHAVEDYRTDPWILNL